MEDPGKPYKGPESYQTHDAELFFGRSTAAEELTARVLSSRVTILHAQSGAGKTSLINAMLIPSLERRGWTPFRILPQDHPTRAVEDAVEHGLFPPAWCEARAIERAFAALRRPEETDLSLAALLSRYDALLPSDPRRRVLISPVRGKPESEAAVGRAFTPHFTRLLRATLDLEDYVARLPVLAIEAGGSLEQPALSSESNALELVARLGHETTSPACRNLLDRLVRQRGLVAFFQSLPVCYGLEGEDLKLVLILDQFEELFTRFVDPGPGQQVDGAGMLDWRLRKEFFEELARLLEWLTVPKTQGSVAAPAPLPVSIRLVLSLRDEYLAQLSPTRFLQTTEHNAFHLQLLEVDNARLAIQEPAERFGFRYADDCYEQLIRELTKEERFVEPAHIQVVCEKLWNTEGRQVARIGDTPDGLPLVRRKTFDELRGTSGILSSYFREVLEQLPEGERAEALELLDSLVTSSGTRNIVERAQLEAEPFRNRDRRQRILGHFVNRSIVRVEPRLGGQFVEITHEFLIRPILDEIKMVLDKDLKYREFRAALRNLRSLCGQGLSSGDGTLLRKSDLRALHEWREEVSWDVWSTELMARNCVVQGLSEGQAEWLQRFANQPPLDDMGALGARIEQEKRRLLTLEELRGLTSSKSVRGDLGPQVAFSALRSSLLFAQVGERDLIAYWAERLVAHGP